jgi:thioredoxin-like negative regulator of GroEL
MNDALRKKNREQSGDLVAPGFAVNARRRRIPWKWAATSMALLLIAVVTIVGVYLWQPDSGRALAVNLSATPPIPPRKNLSDQTTPAPTPPPVEAVTIATAASATDTPRRPKPAEPDSVRGTDAASIPASTDIEPEIGRPGRPSAEAADAPSPPIEASVEPTPRDPTVASRSFEPGPDRPSVRQPDAPPAPPLSRTVNRTSKLTASKRTDSTPSATAGQENLFYEKALAYHRSGRFVQAIRLYRQVLRADADHPGAMLNLSSAYMQQGNFVDAKPLLDRLNHANPRPEGILLNQGIAAIGMGFPEKGLTYLDKAAAESDASAWEIRFHRAVALSRLSRHAEALALYRMVEMERPDDPQLQFNLAVTCDSLERYPQALIHYEAVLHMGPGGSGSERETIVQRIRTIRKYLGNDRWAEKR